MNAYFSNIVNNLEKNSEKSAVKPNMVFSTLKILEYWVRILQANPECINFEIAIRLMDEKQNLSFVDEVVNYFKRFLKKQKHKAPEEESLDFLFNEENNLRTDVCCPRLLRAVKRYLDESKANCSKNVAANFLKVLQNMDSDDMAPNLYHELQNMTCTHFMEYAMSTLRKGISEKDPSFKRVQKIKKIYRLNNDELELLIYLWLRDSNDLEFMESERTFLRHHRFRDNDNNNNGLENISRATGFSIEKLSALFGKNSALNKLNLLDDHFNIPKEVGRFLSGFSDGTEMKAFKEAPEATVSFQQLQGANPDAKLLLTLLKNHKREKPLNILLHGVPGTGKTELSRALAKELGVPLWEISIDVDDDEIGGYRRTDSRNANLLQYRLRAITLADWHCEHNPGFILVDEADMVLNYGEKGSLNHFFESLRTPVIWISNSMHFVEDSTRRRFDFSMAFKPLAKDERLSVLNSVLKAQDAEGLFSDEEKMRLVVEYPAMAGGLALAVQHTKGLLGCGATTEGENYKTMARLLKAHTQLMGIRTGSLKDVESHAPSYSLEGLNIKDSTSEIMEVIHNYDKIWTTLEEDDAPNSLNILLYGPPGTGKTEFVRYIARQLGRNLIIKRASDLLGMYVGQTEAQIAAAFEEARRTKSILFFDEADSILGNRAEAFRDFEVSKVNELLTQMENFKGIFIAATNFESRLDPAGSRRFAIKVGFDYLKPEGIRHMWNVFFPDTECPNSIANLPMLTPGDFNAVNGRMRYLPATSKTPERIEAELRKELSYKDDKAGRSIGF
ncbi:MAG: AAA family ATPase [Fibrobacter sp.]|nr:AAA family ATPase [Fibrobacter sp.]